MSSQPDSLGEAIARAVPVDAPDSVLAEALLAIRLRRAGAREERCPCGYGPFDSCSSHDN